MELTILTGRSNPVLAEAVASSLGTEVGRCVVEDFPDHELHIEIHADVRGSDVYVVQPTSPPAANHLLELLLLADACKRCGAARLTAIVPYFGYARQDRRVRGNEPIGARLLADLLCTRVNRIVVMDLHNPAIEGFFAISVEQLSAVPLLADALRPSISQNHIIVAPDLGAAKLARRYADLLDLPVAYIHKVRISGADVSVRNVIGEVRGRNPIVVDDMISTGGTIVSAVEALLEEGCVPEIAVVASHSLMLAGAAQRLASLPVRSIFVTDSVHQSAEDLLPMRIISMGELLAETVERLHSNCS